eukprot:TRINITY_DN18911_c0_g1_i1.p1 TRINITY_DN18911_c0_g1~~TRINITY_DN18911_c0_g1_i1.p1  ORF type:complete len:261 (-),score=42.48 TRINITY_DN18911_c0_g1_i1:16-798(-)
MNPQMAAMMSGMPQGFISQMQNPYMTVQGGYNMRSVQNNNQSESKPKREKLRVSLTPSERGHYSNLFDMAFPRGSTEIDGPTAAAFLSRSGLSKETLRTIWSIAAQSNQRALNKEEFYVALRLVGLAQGGKEVSEEAIRTNANAGLPRFEGGANASRGMAEESVGKYTITNEDMQKYVGMCNKVDTEQKGYLDTNQLNTVLQKACVPSNAISALKMICDEQGAGNYSLATAVTMLHLLSLIHICRCRRYAVCRSRWSPYH